MSTLTQFVGGGGGVKGVQRGSFSASGLVFNAAVTISPVTMTKSLLIFSRRADSTFATGREDLTTFSGKIDNSTTLRFQRRGQASSSFYTVIIEWQVIEYE